MASIHEHTLSNGMQLLCCPLPHLHSIEFGVYLRGGTLYENRQNQGICHLLEHLCFRCLGGMSGGELTRALDRMGATLDGSTYPEGVVFRLRVLPRFFDDAFLAGTAFFRYSVDRKGHSGRKTGGAPSNRAGGRRL